VINNYYTLKNTEIKQKIIGSVFPEKLIFENNEYRTTKLNDVVTLICPTDKGLGKKKGGKKSDFSESSLRVELARNGSNQFLEDFLNVKKELLDL
jgi:hypothetical protein